MSGKSNLRRIKTLSTKSLMVKSGQSDSQAYDEGSIPFTRSTSYNYISILNGVTVARHFRAYL
jgi:hypothetical protein